MKNQTLLALCIVFLVFFLTFIVTWVGFQGGRFYEREHPKEPFFGTR